MRGDVEEIWRLNQGAGCVGVEDGMPSMTLGELVDSVRLGLDDEPVGVRRSWEETFRYALKHYPSGTPLVEFDLDTLAIKLTEDGMQQQFVAGYLKRWRTLLDVVSEF